MGLDVERRFAAVLEDARKMAPDAYFMTGDFCAHDPVAAVYRRLKAMLDRLDAPYHIIAGNHDDREMLRTTFGLSGAGASPIYYRQSIGGQPFLFLDTSPGLLEPIQLAWLARQLRRHPGADLIMHHPPVPLGVKFMDTKYPLRETDQLYDLLTGDGRRRRIYCGHYHSARVVTHRNLEVYLCPPTSFFIDPAADEFTLRERNPGYQYLEWTEAGDFRCATVEVNP